MITLYVYNIASGAFLYSDSGSANDLIRDLGGNKDFTLTPLPDSSQQWYWVDNKWQPEPKPD